MININFSQVLNTCKPKMCQHKFSIVYLDSLMVRCACEYTAHGFFSHEKCVKLERLQTSAIFVIFVTGNFRLHFC